MIQTVAEFEDATAFELLALGFVPLGPTVSGPSPNVELHNDRPASQYIHATSATTDRSEAAVGAVVDRLRPLLFGAAWKVLDLLIELALFQAGHRPDKHGRVTIKTKVRQARSGCCPPLSTDPGLWTALAASYAATEQVRHSLVHRRAHIDGAGSLVGVDEARAPLPAISASEQEALCRAAQRAAAAVLTGTINARERQDLAAQLDRLAALHGQAVLGGTAAGLVERVRAQARSGPNGRWRLDLPGWRQALGIRTNATWFDLEISGPPGSPDDLALLAHLEDATLDLVDVDASAPPPWLRVL